MGNRCKNCGEKNYSTSYMDCAEKRRMDADGVCFTCAFWLLKADHGGETIIDGGYYSPGNRTSGPMRGMAGRRFDIEYFDGRIITTHDLWFCGVVPEWCRDRLPDTARFINGARRSNIIGGGCAWNSSFGPLPEKPKDPNNEH